MGLKETINILKQVDSNSLEEGEVIKQIKDDFFSNIQSIAQDESIGTSLGDIIDGKATEEQINAFKEKLSQNSISYNIDDSGQMNFNIEGVNNIKIFTHKDGEILTNTINFTKLDEKKKHDARVRKVILISLALFLLTLVGIATWLMIKHIKDKDKNDNPDKDEGNNTQENNSQQQDDDKHKDNQDLIDKLKTEGEDTEQPNTSTGEQVQQDVQSQVNSVTEKGEQKSIVMSNEVVGEPEFQRNRNCEIAKYIETHPNAGIDITVGGKTYKNPLNVHIDTNGNCNFRDVKSGKDIIVDADNCTIYCRDNNYGIINNDIKNIMKSQEIVGDQITYTNTTTNTKVDGNTINMEYKADDGTTYATSKLDEVYYKDGEYVQKQSDGSYLALSDNLQEQLKNTNNDTKQHKSELDLNNLLAYIAL